MTKRNATVRACAALFLAFAGVSLEGGHLVIVALVFLLCLLALWASRMRRPLAGIDSDYLPPLVTGFEAGMMGYAIYGAVFGADNIFQFAVIDLGHRIAHGIEHGWPRDPADLDPGVLALDALLVDGDVDGAGRRGCGE